MSLMPLRCVTLSRWIDMPFGYGSAMTLAVIGLSMLSGSALADMQSTQAVMTESVVEVSTAKLTPEQRRQARQWQLTDRDWVKYLEVMEGPRGIWSPELDPITALGVQETDPAERRRYADIWMRVESRRAELELAFEVERMAAAKRVLGDMKPIDDTGFKAAWANAKQDQRDRYTVKLFTDTTCRDRRCKDLVRDLLASLNPDGTSPLEIYFVAGASSEAIGSWAQDMGISPTIVRQKQVSLNFDSGQFEQYGIAMDDVPEVRVLDRRTGDVKATFTDY